MKEFFDMKRTKQCLGIYTVLLFLLILVTVTLKTVALFNDFDFETEYFKDSPLATVSDWMLVAGSLLMLSFIAVGRAEPLRASFSAPAFYLPSGLVGVALLFMSAEHFKSVFTAALENGNSALGIFKPETLLPLAVALLALASIGYFILGSLVNGRHDLLRSAFGITVAVFLSLYTAYLYFDTELPINAPIKVLDEMAYVFTSVFFLFETRISLGRDKWGAYLAFGMTASLLTAVSSLPALILYFTRGAVITHTLTEAVLTFTLFVFTSARVLHALSLRADKKSPLAELSEIMAEEKTENSLEAETEADTSDDSEPDNYTMTFDEGEAK